MVRRSRVFCASGYSPIRLNPCSRLTGNLPFCHSQNAQPYIHYSLEGMCFRHVETIFVMKKSHVLAVALFVVLQSHCVRGQGSLTPPGSPAPTMKTLSEIEPRTAISSLPYTISAPGSYYVTGNFSNLTGISINTGNVTLDLNGFVLQGPGTGAGVLINGNYTNIVIRNGTLINWNRGADGYTGASPHNVVYENLTVSGNVYQGIAAYSDSVIRNCRAYGNGLTTLQPGIYSYGGEIADCIARGNSTGIFGNNAVIRNCVCETNNGPGIGCIGGSVLDCASFNNTGYGITLQGGASARRCHVQGNLSSGIYIYNTAPILGGAIADCTITTNYYGINLAGSGYLITGNEVAYNNNAGIFVGGFFNRIDGNHVTVPAGAIGFQIAATTNNVIVRNTAFGGGAFNYYVTGTGNDVGPIGNASTNTSPWANISH